MEQPNLNYIQELSGGDSNFEKKLIAILKKEFPEEKSTYLINIQNSNFKKAAENVHKIKHKISILGLEKSYEVAIQHENNLKDDNNSLNPSFLEVLNLISTFLEKV